MRSILKKIKKNKDLQKIIGIIAGMIVLVLVVVLIWGGKEQKSYTLYLKDDEIYYSDASKPKPWQVTTKFLDTDAINTSDLIDVVTYLGMYTKVSPDGKKIFFFDKLTEEGGTLYYRRVNKAKREPVEIAEFVSEFVLNDKGNCVTYLKNNVLYQYDLKKSTKLVKEVEDFYVSPSGENIVYLNSNDEILFKHGNKKTEKIDSDITRIVQVSEACDVVHYLKDDTLFKKESGKEKVKIAEDVYSVPKVYESGEVYFLKEDVCEFKLSDYVEDDMKDKDVDMKEPKETDYEDDNEFQDAYYEYYKMTQREELRLQLEDGKLETSTYELFYYNGKKVESVAKGITASVDVAEKTATVVYSVYGKGEVEKVKISEVDYMFEIEDLIEEALFAKTKSYVAVGKKVSEIQQKKGYDFELDADGKTLYFIDEISPETNHGKLYCAKISGTKVRKPSVYAKKVYKYGAGFVAPGEFVYYKNVNDEGDSGKLFLNEKEVDSDVDLYNLLYLKEDGAIVYMKNWNEDKDFGTLKLFKGNKNTEIAKKAYNYNVLPGGEVIFLTEYDEGNSEGTLFIFKNNKEKKVDEKVSAILPVYVNK